MKKTVNINLNGRVFYIDEDAYARLRNYLDRLEKYFKDQEEGKEIIKDIESRFAELFEEKMKAKTKVVTLEMVNDVMNQMGQPEDFAGEGYEEKGFENETQLPKVVRTKKRLYRDVDNRVLGGVCSGIAAYLNIDPVIIRILFVILPFLSLGIIVPVYIILWIVVPAAVTTAQKLEMRGENVTIKNIEKAIRNEYEDVKERFSKVKDSDTYKRGESWWNRMTKRDKNLIIIVGAIVGTMLLSNLLQFNFDFIDGFYFGNLGFDPGFLANSFFFRDNDFACNLFSSGLYI